MKLMTKTEISTKIGIATSMLDKIIDDIDAVGYQVGKRFYYDYDFIVNKIQENLGKKNTTTVAEKINQTHSINIEYKLVEYKQLRNEINKKINNHNKRINEYASTLKKIEQELSQLFTSADTFIKTRMEKMKVIEDALDGELCFTKQAMLDFIYSYGGINIPAYMKKILTGYDLEEGDNILNTPKGNFVIRIDNGVIIGISKKTD